MIPFISGFQSSGFIVMSAAKQLSFFMPQDATRVLLKKLDVKTFLSLCGADSSVRRFIGDMWPFSKNETAISLFISEIDLPISKPEKNEGSVADSGGIAGVP